MGPKCYEPGLLRNREFNYFYGGSLKSVVDSSGQGGHFLVEKVRGGAWGFLRVS